MDPAGEVEPDGQLVQLEAPAAEYVLAAHCAHEVEEVPKLVLYWPAGQEKDPDELPPPARVRDGVGVAVPAIEAQPLGQPEGEPIVPAFGQKENDVGVADVL